MRTLTNPVRKPQNAQEQQRVQQAYPAADATKFKALFEKAVCLPTPLFFIFSNFFCFLFFISLFLYFFLWGAHVSYVL